MSESEELKLALAKVAIEYWRVVRSYERSLANIPNNSSAAATVRHSEKKLVAILAEFGLRFITFEGQEYSPNLPITVVNGTDFSSNEQLQVAQMFEPTIMSGDKIINIGKAILAKRET